MLHVLLPCVLRVLRPHVLHVRLPRVRHVLLLLLLPASSPPVLLPLLRGPRPPIHPLPHDAAPRALAQQSSDHWRCPARRRGHTMATCNGM
jgi:hypothetical protein